MQIFQDNETFEIDIEKTQYYEVELLIFESYI